MFSILIANSYSAFTGRLVRNEKQASVRSRGVPDGKAGTPGGNGKWVLDNQRANAMLDFIGDAVLCTDMDTNITYLNQAAETLTGFSRKEALGRPIEQVCHVIDVNTRQNRANIARRVINTDCAVALHNGALLISRDGTQLAIEDAATPLHNEQGKMIGALVKFHDSRFSEETARKMAFLSQHDPLTGLLNRPAFAARFEQAARLATRHQKKMVLLFIDLDNFKAVNDTLGHARGDAILKALGQQLLGSVRATDHVCRHGGDEFVVLLSDLEQHQQAFAVVDKLREAAADVLRLSASAPLGVSIGVSIYPDNGDTLEALLVHADEAMYKVKASQKRGRDYPSERRPPIGALHV